jgi:transposase-like protein
MDRDSLRLLLEKGLSVEKIAKRFGKNPSTISYWMNKHGLEAPNRDKHAAKGGIERERLTELVDAGLTIARIADEVGVSRTTVRYWLRNYGLRTKNKVGPRLGEPARIAKSAGLAEHQFVCATHGETAYVIEGRGYYRCKRCRSDQIARHRRKMKDLLVAEAGGRCSACGYEGFAGALAFHHLNPATKRFQLSGVGLTRALSELRSEAAKCVLLCSNCHAEVEGGVRTLGVELSQTLTTPDTP